MMHQQDNGFMDDGPLAVVRELRTPDQKPPPQREDDVANGPGGKTRYDLPPIDKSGRVDQEYDGSVDPFLLPCG